MFLPHPGLRSQAKYNALSAFDPELCSREKEEVALRLCVNSLSKSAKMPVLPYIEISILELLEHFSPDLGCENGPLKDRMLGSAVVSVPGTDRLM